MQRNNLDFIGKKVVKKSGDIFSIVSVDFDNKCRVVLDDGKLGYDLDKAIPSKLLCFIDSSFQETVENKLMDLANQVDNNLNKNKNDRIIEYAIKLFKGHGARRNISNTYSKRFSKLVAGTIYGKKALPIYEEGCKYLVFFTSKKGFFGKQKLLYATPATCEGYGVWMLPHNNLNGEAGSWANIIESDVIYEVWGIEDKEKHQDMRLAFVKQGNGEYVFVGVYKLEKTEEINKRIDGVRLFVRKTYKRVSNVYPEE